MISLSDLSGQPSLGLRSWPSCFVTFVYREVVLSPQCANLCSPGCTGQHKLHYSADACFVLRMSKFLPQHVGRFKVNQDMMFIEDPPESLRCSCNIRNNDVVEFSRLLLCLLWIY